MLPDVLELLDEEDVEDETEDEEELEMEVLSLRSSICSSMV